MKHRWFKDEYNKWMIECLEENKWFCPEISCFREFGICPYCKKNIREEFEQRRKWREEKRDQKERKERIEARGRITSYF